MARVNTIVVWLCLTAVLGDDAIQEVDESTEPLMIGAVQPEEMDNMTEPFELSSWNQVLRAHNVYRCMHGVPYLRWDPTIARTAQAWASHTRGNMVHGGMSSPRGRVGQNLVGLLPQYGYDEVRGVKMWYDEIKHTRGGRVTSFGMNTGHYTQVVWRSTRFLGCGEWRRGTCNNGNNKCLLVCDYFPAGNMMGAFARNVNGPTRSQAQCSRMVAEMEEEEEAGALSSNQVWTAPAFFAACTVGAAVGAIVGLFALRRKSADTATNYGPLLS